MDLNNILTQQLNHQLPVPGKTGLDWYFFSWFLNYSKRTRMLEIGAGDGGSTLTMASFAKELVVIDSWDQGWLKQPVEHSTTSNNLPVTYIDNHSADVIIEDLGKFSFVHLDANKGFDEVIADLTLASSVCNGIICVDDYLQSMWPEVTWAVDKWISNTSWLRTFIGNHQVFLTPKRLRIPELVVEWPVIDRGHGYHLTYGEYPNNSIIKQFLEKGNMTYTWHNNAQK